MISVAIGIQARSTSTRYPNKVKETIGTKSVIQHVIDAAKNCADYINRYSFRNNIQATVFVLIPENDSLKDFIKEPGLVIEGNEHDVLSRYFLLQEKVKSDYMVRLTADCPLVPPFIIFKCVNTAIKNSFDYFSNTGDIDADFRTSIDGHDVEVLSAKALTWLNENAKDKSDREHVTSFIRRADAPNYFKKGILIGHNDLSHVKLSLDDKNDFEAILKEYDKLESKIKLAESIYGKKSVHRY